MVGGGTVSKSSKLDRKQRENSTSDSLRFSPSWGEWQVADQSEMYQRDSGNERATEEL